VKPFDAVVIGSGQAGNPLAHRLADKGWTVALIEREHLGGSCINDGCTPTKTMLASAQIAHYARRAADFGVRAGPVAVDLASVVKRKNDIVLQWRNGQERHAAKRPTITLYRGAAKFVEPHVVRVNDEDLTGKHIFVNTGTSPLILPIEGIDSVPYLTNRNVMDLTELPEHLLVIGGSCVGLEFAQMFSRFGSRVTVVEFADRIVNTLKLSTAGRLVPYALFTDPELGRVGLTESEARASGRNVRVGSIPVSRVARAIERNETAGVMKVVVDADTERILGAAILGQGGGELVQTLMALMMADVSWRIFYRAVYIHPTMTEGFFALMDSVK
jgi:pyruvate/2-oxoglutarate dehydrogenase complex dihydrolipoamide dehydrogenase (E3) component